MQKRMLFLLAVVILTVNLSIIGNRAQAQDPQSAIQHAKALSQAFRFGASKARPSVVTIISKSRVPALGMRRRDLPDLFRDPRFRELFPDGLPFEIPKDRDEDDDDDAEEGEGALANSVGSGVIIDSSGIILTNNHVVANADEVVVRLPDGREFQAAEIKKDPLSDIATLRIKDAGMLRAARLGDSDKLDIGDWVMAIGNPFELESTVSAGIISGKGRGIHQIVRGTLIQTDAAINPGNSGGPLVNLDGEVVGINTAIASNSGGYQGIGFAIPVNRAKWVSNELLVHGKVRRAFLGVQIDELSPREAARLGRPARSGVLVRAVVPNGPADDAGIRVDDVIVEFADQPTRRPRALMDAVEQKPLGSNQAVKIIREGRTKTVDVMVKALEEFQRDE